MNFARLLIILFALSLVSPSEAQIPPLPGDTTQPSVTKPYTLVEALSGGALPGVALAVGVSRTQMPPDVPLLKDGATLNQVASAFGLIVRRFGTVTALSPPTMTLVNANPSNPDIFQDLAPRDKFKLFAASLSQTQWQALTGERGLGLSDLTDDRQRAMFAALFPNRLTVQPRNFPGQVIEPDAALDLTSGLLLARLRFAQRMNIMVPLTDHSSLSLSDFYKPNGPPEYVTNSPPEPNDKSTTYGVPVRQDMPNVLKATPLDWNANALEKPISLSGVKTVGDLVQRIGHQSHLELYTDARWEKTPVALSGAAPTATGRDLLQALALCLTRTYRPVSPAFVLTADQVGDGTREQIWDEFAEQVAQAGADQINQAAQQLGRAHSPRDLSWYGDPLAYSQEQLQKTDPRFPRLEDLPFAQLTPAQQTAVRGLAAQMVSDPIHVQGGEALQVDLTGKFSLEARPQVQVIVPSVASPITMYDLSRNLYVMSNIFYPSREDDMAQIRQILAKQNAPSPAVSIPDLTTRLAAAPRRAVLAYPHTAADVDALIASMKTIGLN